jgi:hypothetical protein
LLDTGFVIARDPYHEQAKRLDRELLDAGVELV